MTARTARRISQPDCAPRAPSPTKNGAGTPPSPLAQFHPRNALPRVPFRGQDPKSRSNPDRTAAAASAVAVLNKKRGRRATTTCAASSAQRTAASLLRGQNPKGRSVLDSTACAASFRASPRRVGVRVLQSAGVHSEVNRRYRD
jgi:hypothetical protein